MPQKKRPITQRPKVEDESTGNPPDKHGKHREDDEALPGKGGTKAGLNKYSGVARRKKADAEHRRPADPTGGTKENYGKPKGKSQEESRSRSKPSRSRGPERKA